MKQKRILGIFTAAIFLLNSASAFADTEYTAEAADEISEQQEIINYTAADLSLPNEESDELLTVMDTASSDTSVDVPSFEDFTGLTPNTLDTKNVAPNPYVGSLDAAIHNDVYSTDVVDSIAPLGIYPEVAYGMEPDSYNATPNAYYDDEGHAIAAYQGGVAIKELSRDKVEVLGSFIPARDDGESYSVQTSYSFVDCYGNIIFPTSHGHIAIVSPTDNNGNVLKVFNKIMDADIVTEAVNALGDDIDKNLLSIVYDYQGNLWFASGGFRKDPAYSKAGFIGVLSREYIDAALKGENLELSKYISFIRLTDGENAENGISSCQNGAVILTNKSCYLLSKEESINIKWKVDYDSVPKKALEGTNVTGIGLAWGGGSTPTLTNDLVLFTDNCTPVKLIAVSTNTGEIVATAPILDSLTGKEQVSVENSIMVYSPSADRTSVIICNWFGAGNSKLDSPDADSSIQTYENIYDSNWMKEGNKYISPGVERIDVIKSENGYQMKSIWTREDIRDTSMLKLSTSTGYIYGYWQNIDTGYWGYNILDFDSGETKLEVPVSNEPEYNNMAVGMIIDINGNALYCPTNDKVLLRLQDRFVYMPLHTDIKINIDETARKNISNSFNDYSDADSVPVSYLNTAVFEAIDNKDTIAFRVNGIKNKTVNELTLYAMDTSNKLQPADYDSWQITDEAGRVLEPDEQLIPENLYEIRFNIADADKFDLCDESGKIKVSIVLCEEGSIETTTETATESSTETAVETESQATTQTASTDSSSANRSSSGGGSSSYRAAGKVEETSETSTLSEKNTSAQTNASSETENKNSSEKISSQSNPFTDVADNAWYAESVKYVYENGIFNGINNTLFAPEANVTRGMLVTVLGRMSGINTSDYTGVSFTDINATAYYAPYIEWAAENKIAAGFENNTFKPDESVTREQLAKIITNYCNYMGQNTTIEEINLPFSDASLISAWAIDSVQYCCNTGLISGDDKGMFNPKKSLSRAELAAIMSKIALA